MGNVTYYAVLPSFAMRMATCAPTRRSSANRRLEQPHVLEPLQLRRPGRSRSLEPVIPMPASGPMPSS